MTFTPSVLSKVDARNTSTVQLTPNATFTGQPTVTTGYDTLIITVSTDTPSAPGGLQVQMSDSAAPASFDTFYTDTVFAGSVFTRTYLITKAYYRVLYTTLAATTTFELTTRITPQLDTSALAQASSISVFDNAVETSMDAFGKLRVTTPSTLVELRFPVLAAGAVNPQVSWNQLQLNTYQTAGGWGLGAGGDGTFLLSATGAGPGVCLTQSRTFVTYQPGKSFLMLFSGVFKPSNNTYNSSVGLFDTAVAAAPYVNNGVFLAFNGGVASVNIANAGTVSSIPQSEWNVDKMNGTGPSGLRLDFSQAQLFAIDLEWLGVGRVRFGFYAYGRIQYCHQVTNINALVAPYTPSMNLPVTYMLWSAARNQGTSITQICSTVMSEGGYTPVGRPFSANTGHNAATEQILVSTTETPLLAIRGSSARGYYHQTIVPTNFSLIDTDMNNTLLFRARFYQGGALLPQVVATTWTQASPYSLVEYAQGKVGNVNNFTTFLTSDSIVVSSGYILGKGSNIIGNLETAFTNLLLSLSSSVTNAPDIFVVTAQRVSDNASTAKVWASIDWQEVY